MCCKRSPTLGNRGQLFHCIICEMELENISNWPILGLFEVTSWNYNDLLIRNVNGAAKSELLVKTVLLHIINILGREKVPFLAGLRPKLCLGAYRVQVSVHHEATCVLKEFVLFLHVRAISNADGAHNMWYNAIIKLLWELLHSLLVFNVQELKDLVEDVLGLSNLDHVCLAISVFNLSWNIFIIYV